LTEAVDGSPCVKVLDFGISRMSRRHGLSALTDPGTVLGTPSYMAPEQMEAADTVDARSDIWALGTILFELLTGKPPYTGESLPQIFMKIMRSKTPKASAVRADVPSGLDAIIARCLEIDAPERFQSVAELAWALSTVGAPHARDSAARISRVFDKQSSEHPEETPSGTLRSTVPPPVVNAVRRRGHSRSVRERRTITALIAGATLLGAASVFTVLAVRGAVDARAEAEQTASEERMAPGPRTTDDAAVTIAPRMRPIAQPPRAAGVVTPGPAQIAMVHVSTAAAATAAAPREAATKAEAHAVSPSATKPDAAIGAGLARDHGAEEPAPAPAREGPPLSNGD
jgi:serine/threonine-protein kinase